MVVVAGGDGTINETADGLVHRDLLNIKTTRFPSLAIIPIGTANVLAAETGLGRKPRNAARVIAYGDIQPAWVGLANGRVFCQMAGVGFDAHVVDNVDAGLKKRLGKAAYGIAMLR